MSLVFRYASAPGAPLWTMTLDEAVRLGRISGLVSCAEQGTVGTCSIALDDPAGDLGHDDDAILGLQRFVVEEDSAPSGAQQIFYGLVGDRRYSRADSLRTGVSRRVDCTLVDGANARLSYRIMTGSDANRPAETDVARVQWWLGSSYNSGITDDAALVNVDGPINMDACDYRGQTSSDLLRDCSVQSGKNYYALFWEATGTFALWYDFAESEAWPSAIRLTNVLSEVDPEGDPPTFAVDMDAELTRDPSRVYAGVYLPYSGGVVYKQRAATATIYGLRDVSAPTANIKSAAKAEALADRYLFDNSTEDDRAKCSVRLPMSQITAIKAGMRVSCHFSHFPGYEAAFKSWRVLRCEFAQDKETDEYGWLRLEMTPIVVYEAYAGILTHMAGNDWNADGDPEPQYGDGALVVGWWATGDNPNPGGGTGRTPEPLEGWAEYVEFDPPLTRGGLPMYRGIRMTKGGKVSIHHMGRFGGVCVDSASVITVDIRRNDVVISTQTQTSDYPGGYTFFGGMFEFSLSDIECNAGDVFSVGVVMTGWAGPEWVYYGNVPGDINMDGNLRVGRPTLPDYP